MSRKGNSTDNGMMESFFGILKSEMFYGYEKTFQSLNQLEQAIVEAHPDAFLREIAAHFDCAVPSVWAALKKINVTLKKDD